MSKLNPDTVLQPPDEDLAKRGLMYGFPNDKVVMDSGAEEILKLSSALEGAGITCCMIGTSALVYYGANRFRGDWQVCVPTENFDAAKLLLQSSPFKNKYTQSPPLPNIGIESLLHTFPRFKLNDVELWFLLVPSEDCHIDVTPTNIERSKLGIPYPKLEFYAQSLLDTYRRVDLCDLVDGMNLSREWGEEHLDLNGTNDTAWAIKKNELIEKSMLDNEYACFAFLCDGEMPRRQFWEETTSLKEHRLGFKYPREWYATRFRLHSQGDPRDGEREYC